MIRRGKRMKDWESARERLVRQKKTNTQNGNKSPKIKFKHKKMFITFNERRNKVKNKYTHIHTKSVYNN